jgi:Na+(H+)/acetate symporter ActP
MGLFWRRATVAGAWASALAGFAAWWLVMQPFFIAWVDSLSISDPLRLVVESKGKLAIYEPWQISSYLGTGLIAGILVSLLTPAVSSERLQRFYALTRTPIQPNEQIEEPCTLPTGVEPAARPMLVTAFGLEIPRPSATSVLGFVVGWVCVLALIAGFVLLIGSGR